MAAMAVEDDIASTMRINEGPAQSITTPSRQQVSKALAGPSFSAPAKLEPFLLLAKSARGAGAAKLIEQATASPGVYVFGELLDMPVVKELASQEQFAAHYRLLQLFAYGTWRDYTTNIASYPPLNDAHIFKLKQLTLVTLASAARILPYSFLMQSLDISSVRELEDLVIEAIYGEIMTGRLDQRNSRLAVDGVTGRDVRELDPCFKSLMAWSDQITQAISLLDQKIADARKSDAQKERAKTNQTNAIHKALQEINASNASGKNNRNAADFGDYPNPMRSPYKGSSRTAGKENGGFGTDGMDVDDNDDGKRRSNRKRNRAT